MQTCHMVELAALVSMRGPALIAGNGDLQASGVEQYWIASRSRFDAWGRALKHGSASAGHRTLVSVVEEILVSEVLTRVWTSVLCAYDRSRGRREVEPVALSILIGHMESRHRALSLLVQASLIPPDDAISLHRLRGKTERWVDLLVGRLADEYDVSEFAADPRRARDFAEDLRRLSASSSGKHAWPILLGSLRAAFEPSLLTQSPNSELNHRVAEAVLHCFPPLLIESAMGLFPSLWPASGPSISPLPLGMTTLRRRGVSWE